MTVERRMGRRPVKVVRTDAAAHAGHAPDREFAGGELTPYPEVPARVAAIEQALAATSWAEMTAADPHDDGALTAVHDGDYLAFLRTAHGAWMRGRRHRGDGGGASDPLVASVFARDGQPPAPGAARVGWYGFDTTPLTAGTWTAARAAADAVLTAAGLVAGGQSVAYALCRPPGHHAGRARFGGYCFLNHAALAARRLAAGGAVAIVDIDYHHGNGTQEIFYEDGDVLFVSLHADPAWEYPLYWGYADEIGAGAGAGCTLNVPLPAATGDDRYLDELDRALADVRRFAPASLVVSAGFDGFVDDPLGTFRLSRDGFARIGAALEALALPTVVVQEGGYRVEALGEVARAFLEPWSGR